jgi:predicted nucleic acid-binding protein
MRFVDTNVFVDHLRGHPPAVAFFRGLRGSDDVAFSSLCEAELIAGRANEDPKVRSALLRFLHQWTKVDVSNQISLRAGDIVRELGLVVPDAIIAATALGHKAELITRNAKDFRRIKGLRVRVPY